MSNWTPVSILRRTKSVGPNGQRATSNKPQLFVGLLSSFQLIFDLALTQCSSNYYTDLRIVIKRLIPFTQNWTPTQQRPRISVDVIVLLKCNASKIQLCWPLSDHLVLHISATTGDQRRIIAVGITGKWLNNAQCCYIIGFRRTTVGGITQGKLFSPCNGRYRCYSSGFIIRREFWSDAMVRFGHDNDLICWVLCLNVSLAQ